jgi:hypothetical protein
MLAYVQVYWNRSVDKISRRYNALKRTIKLQAITGPCHTIVELREHIDALSANYNKFAEPFVWTKSKFVQKCSRITFHRPRTHFGTNSLLGAGDRELDLKDLDKVLLSRPTQAGPLRAADAIACGGRAYA